MKKSYSFFNIIVALFLICTVTIQAQTLVTQWGSTPRGNNWPILNTAATPAGSASMGADARPTAWASIKGGFDTFTPTTTQAFVITGTFEFVGGGGGSAYTWLRYALFYQDPTTLTNQNTPTAAWSAANCWGYQFDPRTGTGTIANAGGGQGTLWTVVNSGGWNSSYANGKPLSTVYNAPERAVATAGVYDWAISVQPLADGTNEIRYYFVKQHAVGQQASYWFAGTTIEATPVATTRFNSIGFSVNNDLDATCKQVNLTNVTVGLGAPITIPEAPWQAYYVNKFGFLGGRQGNWKFMPDPEAIVGNAGIGGDASLSVEWGAIRGELDRPITATTSKAIIVTGNVEFVGSGIDTWSGLRYGLFMHDAAGTLITTNPDSTRWSGSESSSHGYMFSPISGTNRATDGVSGGLGTQWIRVSGNYISTSSGSGPITFGGLSNQKPARAVAGPGKYAFAFCVLPQADGTKRVRFYLIKGNVALSATSAYYFAGEFIDATALAPTFNGVVFAAHATGSGPNPNLRGVMLTDVKVDIGTPFELPEAPWNAYYADKFGLYGTPTGGWTYTADEIIGNATASGPASNQSSASLRAEFIDPLIPTTTKALVITGKMEFVGDGFQASGALRYGIFNSASAGTLTNGVWSGSEMENTGYLFIPPGSYQSQVYWLNSKQNGTWGSIVNDNWYLPNGPNDNVLGNEQPTQSFSTKAGIYEFGLSVAPQANGSNEIRNYLISSGDEGRTFYWATTATDTRVPAATNKFNSMNFRFDRNPLTTAMKILDLKIDLGDPIVIPPDPNATAVESVESLPTEYALNQNYPNPFNPTTTIEFALPQNDNVRLVVYDLLGRVVSELVNGNLVAGYHKVNFNASNLASGIYFYSLSAGEFSSVKKLVILK